MLDSPDLEVPHFDEADLDALIRLTLSRSAGLRASRRLTGAGVLVIVAALVAGLVVVLPGQASPPGRHAARSGDTGGQWRLVDDVTNVSSWGTITANGFQPSLDLTCPAVGTCYADADGQIEFTHDGGRSWQQASGITTAPMKGDISCADAEHCTVLGNATTGGATVSVTSDGGSHWTAHPGPAQIASIGIGTKLSCVSATRCVVVSADGGHGGTMVRVPSGSPALVLTTSDGGATWAQSSEIPDGVAPMDFSCQSSGVCIVSGLAGAYGDATDTTYVSSDAGGSWEAAALPAGAGPLLSVTCPTSSHCLAVSLNVADPGAGETLLVSSNGGRDWSAQGASGLPSALLSTVSCSSSSGCWLAGALRPAGGAALVGSDGQGLLAWTDDAGSNWHQVTVPAGVGPVLDVTCPSTTTCYALGMEPSSDQTPGAGGPVVLLATSAS